MVFNSKFFLAGLLALASVSCKTRAFNGDDNQDDSEMLSLVSEEAVKTVTRYADTNAETIIKAFNSGDTEAGLKLLESSGEGNSLHVLGLVARKANGLETLGKKINFLESLPEGVRKDMPTTMMKMGEDITRSSAAMKRMGYTFFATRSRAYASNLVRSATKDFKILATSLKGTYGSVSNIDQYAAATVLGKFATNSAEVKGLGDALKSGQKQGLMYSVYTSSEEAEAIFNQAIKNGPADFKKTAERQFNDLGSEVNLSGEFSIYQPYATKVKNESLPRLTESNVVPSLDKGAAIMHNDLEAAERGINPAGFKKRSLDKMVCLTEEFVSKAGNIVKITGGASYARLSEQALKSTLSAYKSVRVVTSGGKELYQVGGKQFGTAIELNTWLAQSASIVR